MKGMQHTEAYAHYALSDRVDDPDVSSLGSLSNDVDPVTLVLSCRLLRSEAARAAAVNQTAVLNSKLSQMPVHGSTIYTVLALPASTRTSEVMSEDGANKSIWGSAKCHNNREIVRVSAPDTTRSVASSGARSINSLPIKYMPRSPQRLKYTHRAVVLMLLDSLTLMFRCHASHLEQRPDFCGKRSSSQLLPVPCLHARCPSALSIESQHANSTDVAPK